MGYSDCQCCREEAREYAVWQNLKLKEELTVIILNDLEKETSLLCSKRNPLSLRTTDKESMLSFSMEKLEDRIKHRAPLTFSCLSKIAISRKSKATSPPSDHCGAIGMAAAICLRNRSKSVIAVQLLITMFLYHSSWMVRLYSIIMCTIEIKFIIYYHYY